jgi:hypothetical protein
MLALAYLGLIFFILFLEIIRRKDSSIDFLTLFHIFFVLWYPLPALVLDISSFGNVGLALTFDGSKYTSNIQTALAIFVGYFCVFIGFYSKSAVQFGEKIIIKSYSDKNIIVFAILLLLFGSVSIHIYSSQHGGLLNAVSQAMIIRSSTEANLEGGNLLFFKPLMFFVFFSSYLLGSYIIFKPKKTNLFLIFIFSITVVVSVLAAIIASGRQRVINYVLVFYLGYILKTKKFNLGLILPLLYFAILFILYGKALFFSLTALPDGLFAVVEKFLESLHDKSDSDFDFYTLIANFVYPIHSLDAAFNNKYEMRLFVDFIYAFLDLLPDRLLGTEPPKSLGEYNTFFIAKTNEYAIPPGFLAFGIYSMSWSGLIIFCFIFGWLGRYLQTIFNRHLHSVYWMPFFYALTAKTWTDFCGSGEPQVFLISNFWYFISSVLLVFLLSKVSLARHHNQKNMEKKSRVPRY